MNKISICVFCSSSNQINSQFQEVAENLGKLIAESGCNLVHGGGKIGLMGIIARSVQKHGGQVTGVLPEQLNIEGIASETDDEIIITKDMADRKTEMRKRSRAFIALPGGFGTIEELLEVLTLKQLGTLNYPIVILNINHYFDNLLNFFELMYKEKFTDESYRNLYFVVNTPEDAMDYILQYKYPEIKKKWLL